MKLLARRPFLFLAIVCPFYGVRYKAACGFVVAHQPRERAFVLEVKVWDRCIKDGLRAAS